MISIAAIKGDDADFIALVNRIVGRILQEDNPSDVFLIRINCWFDHKWRTFSGKLLGAVTVRQQRLTIPPFVPERVLTQHTYTLDEDSASYRPVDAPALHLRQPSGDNLNRFIARLSRAGLFVWFSGDTQSAAGCIMVYFCRGDLQTSWYAALRAGKPWRIDKLQGISKSEFLHLAEGALHEKGA